MNNNNNKHWSHKVHEINIPNDLIKKLNLIEHIKGGSDSGEFIYFDSLLNIPESFVSQINGKLNTNEIILEIDTHKISGYTLFDVKTLLKQLIISTTTNKLIKFNTIKINYLPKQLRLYLDERFQKDSIDYNLQTCIRENVYMRTVPCTTRPARKGEINGQDYIFLSNNEFLELEKKGNLLEYGVFNGHYYGTPKPPKEPSTPILSNSNSTISNINSNNHSLIKRNNSINDMKQQHQLLSPLQQQSAETKHMLNGNNNTPTSSTTTTSSSTEHQSKFIIHDENINNQQQQELDYQEEKDLEGDEILPYGWEKIEDSEYGTFYIDHINKQTTYDNPLLKQQQQQEHKKEMKTFKSTPTTITTQRYFTLNPSELKGDFYKTTLAKTTQGFGFTIIGANETSDDYLQIKYIVPNGAAYLDGVLKQGDILVFVNKQCVLGYTHQNVVEMFQSIQVGDYVELTVCRGYPLSIDPNDPNIEIKPLPAIVQQQQVTQLTNDYGDLINDINEDYNEFNVSIIKGPMGFGFTIADDSLHNYQKVKQILDKERCLYLLEGDILLEINGISLINLTHNQVVDILKECKKGQETRIKLKRNKLNTLKGEFRSKTPNHLVNEQQATSSPNKNDNYYYLNQTQPQLEEVVQPQQILNYTKLPQSSSSSLVKEITQQQQQQQTNDLYSTINRKSERDLTSLSKENNRHNNNKLLTTSTKFDPTQSRSKTPGPEMFRDRTNNLTSSNTMNDISFNGQKQQQFDFNNKKYNTVNNQNHFQIQQQQQQRSKTPTADMFYTYKQRNNLNETQFNGIYQPFMQTPNKMNSYVQDELNTATTTTQSNLIQYKYIDVFVELYRQESGFGFRIIGGEEEGSQVSVGYIVPNGAADLDSRLKPNDEIVMIDNENVIGASHKRVVRLMTIAGLNRKVKLWVKRKVPINLTDTSSYPFTITLFRNGHEGFGFVIISATNRNGPSIGKIVENSPAERCGRLHVGDRILAVNNIDITQMNHVDIVKLIKESGNSITLTIGSPMEEPLIYSNAPSSTNISPKILNGTNYETVLPIRNEMNYNYSTLPQPAAVSTQLPIQIPNQQQQQLQQHSSSSKSHISLNNSPQQQIQNQFSRQSSYQKMQSYQQPTTQTQTQSESNLYHVIELRKPTSTGFGFSIRGGKEFNIPIFILKLADNGPAALDGRLKVGDQILEINGYDAYIMTHNEAIEHIKAGGNTVTLLVRRTGLPPPSITDIITANATINQNSRAPSTLPYHQSESTLIRPKSPYLPINNDTNYGAYGTLQNQQPYQSQKHFYSSSALRN